MSVRTIGKKSVVSRIPWLKLIIFASVLDPGACGWYQDDIVTITAEDFRFTPRQVVVPADRPLTLVIRNQGRERHVFHSPRLFGDGKISFITSPTGTERPADTVILKPGNTITVSMELSIGTYPFRCWMKGHVGMEGTIIVQEREASSGLSTL